MKKLLLVLAAAFAMVACQTDINEVGVVAEGVATVEFEVGAPQMRSFSDGMTATVLQYAVYDAQGEELSNLRKENVELVNGRANVKIELANNKSYSIIFWAEAEGAPYTFNFAEKTVTVDYTNAECNDESRDAFYAYKPFEVKGAATLGVELRRPFAQVNVGTSDLAEAAKSHFVPSTSALIVEDVFSTLNLVDGTALGNTTDVTFAATTVPAGEEFKVAGHDYLAMSYVLVGKDKGSYDVTYTINAADGTVIANTIGAVPMQANYRTNIYGKLLTSTTDINVEINPDYYEPSKEAEALYLAAAVGGEVTLTEDVVLPTTLNVITNMTIDLNGKTITALSGDGYAIINEGGATLQITNGKTRTATNGGVINGIVYTGENSTTIVDGGTFNALENANYIFLNSGGNLTINNATINHCGTYPIYSYNEGNKLVINNATINGTFGCINAYGVNGEVVINGGTFQMTGVQGNTSHIAYFSSKVKAIINGGTFEKIGDISMSGTGGGGVCLAGGANLTINGGTFAGDYADVYDWGGTYSIAGGIYKFQPANVVAGYKAVLSNGKYVVVANDVDAVASTQGELETALTAGGDVVLTAGEYTFPADKIQAGTTINCAEGTIFTGTSGLNINGATVIGATFKNEGGVAVSGTIYGTLKNCTFEGEEALRWCYTEAGKTVVFENCVINNDFRGFHFDDMKGDVLFKNCHINGFNAYGGEGTATFEGCTFGTDDRSRYNGLNIYANTVLTDCTFIYKSGKTNFIDMEAAGKSLTITNCTATLDGAAANVADYVGGSKLPECTVTIDGELYIAPVATADALKKAINAGEQTIYVKGQIDLTEEILAGYNGTIIGADDTACINTRTFVVKSADEAFHLSNKTINFKNITIKVPTEDGDFLKTGFVAAGTMNFDHCVFEGQVTLNGSATWTFDDCEFGGADSGAYASFVYAAKKVNFNRCSFSGVDRAAKVYGAGGAIDVVYNNCTFTSTTSNKYAVNIDASYATTTVALNGCSQTGMPGLYLVAGTKATVYVDGVQQ